MSSFSTARPSNLSPVLCYHFQESFPVCPICSAPFPPACLPSQSLLSNMYLTHTFILFHPNLWHCRRHHACYVIGRWRQSSCPCDRAGGPDIAPQRTYPCVCVILSERCTATIKLAYRAHCSYCNIIWKHVTGLLFMPTLFFVKLNISWHDNSKKSAEGTVIVDDNHKSLRE